jgi:23S rRNA (uracil1939-C5)-methyltransferase
VLSAGQLVPLTIEKPASGGRMIARLEGQVLLVSGAIPGERIAARVERVMKGVGYAVAEKIDLSSPDRREAIADPLCGGCLYSHIAYARQLELKAQVIEDALARIGHLQAPEAISVLPSREDGYRMRARLHVRAGRAGFFREATHDICDARATRQLLPETSDVIEESVARYTASGAGELRELEITENVEASERVVHLEIVLRAPEKPRLEFLDMNGLTGVHASASPAAGPARRPIVVDRGTPYVTDVVAVGATRVSLRRHVLAFFQGNRYLLEPLLSHVVAQVESGSKVVDLYAGTGLFAIAAAASRGARVTAVEGDRVAAADLEHNASAAAADVRSIHQPVEAFAPSKPDPDCVIVDPPRTGVSREGMETILRIDGRRVVYVSCDVATLARDARRLVEAGYRMTGIKAFDLFPNTPHVETVAVFDR